MSVQVAQRRFTTVKGQTIAADVAGPENGAPVVLMHGGGQTRYSWKNGLRILAEAGYRTYSLDARGHGESDWDKDGDYRSGGQTEDLFAVLKQIPGRPVLVGASMGGITALMALGESTAPLARGLVLVDVTPKIDWDGAMKISAFMNANRDGFATVEEAADAVSAYNPNRPRPKDISGLKRNLRERDGRWYWHWDPAFLQLGRTIDPEQMWRTLEAAALKVQVPTLLVRGALSDLVGAAEIAHFREVMPHAEYVDVAGAGHMVAGDKNDAFNTAIVEFVRRVDAGQGKPR